MRSPLVAAVACLLLVGCRTNESPEAQVDRRDPAEIICAAGATGGTPIRAVE